VLLRQFYDTDLVRDDDRWVIEQIVVRDMFEMGMTYRCRPHVRGRACGREPTGDPMSSAQLTLPPVAVRAPVKPTARLQRRTIVTLVAAQIAGGMGLAAAVTVGSLIAADLGGDAVAGLPLAASLSGTATAALPLAAVMRRSGRRPGLRLGWVVGAVGAAVAITATVLSSLPLLLVGMLLFGGAEAASSAARFAAADLASPERRGSAIGMVVSSTAVTATVGPGMVGPATGAAAAIGLPALAGPFAVSVVAFTIASTVIWVALRPDPLIVAGAVASDGHVAEPASTPAPFRTVLRQSAVRLGVAAVVVANSTMLMLMTVTPLHLTGGHEHSDRLGVVGLIISVHIGAMLAPAPLTGRLGDHFGHRRLIVAGAVLIGLSGVTATTAAPQDTIAVLVALTLLGLGWNCTFIGGSALLTSAVSAAQRPRVQGLADMAMGFAGVLGAGTSGLIMAAGGFGRLGLLATAIASTLALSALRPDTDRTSTR
jgi:MFS family permease